MVSGLSTMSRRLEGIVLEKIPPPASNVLETQRLHFLINALTNQEPSACC